MAFLNQSRTHRAKQIAIAAILALVAAPGVAQAQTADTDRATARALARDGYEAQKRGDYAAAADRFARAEGLVHAPTLLLGLARANVGLGKLVEAHEGYDQILREGVGSQAPPAFAKAVQDAKVEVTALAPRLAWVTIQVRGPASPAVRLDGAPLPALGLGIRRACDPGQHTVDISASGFGQVTRTFSTPEGGEQTIAVTMDRLPGPVPGEAETGRMPAAATAGVAILGVGVAGWLVGGVVGAFALAKHSSLNGDCPDARCAPDQSGAVDAYRTLATVSTVAMVVGGLGTATGITLLVTAPKSATTVMVYADPRGVGVRGAF